MNFGSDVAEAKNCKEELRLYCQRYGCVIEDVLVRYYRLFKDEADISKYFEELDSKMVDK